MPTALASDSRPREVPARVFLLSPANCSGRRAQQLLRAGAGGEMAVRLRSAEGLPLGELFAFMSGLYFRGKLAYATRFAAPPNATQGTSTGVHIITPNSGLRRHDTVVRIDDVRAFSEVSIDLANDAYRRPLEHSARDLLTQSGACQVVLLGSIASPKYVDVLLEIFGDRLCFPVAFVGRGDMSRGGLLLRQVAAGEELEYAPIAGAVRHGAKPPRLPRLSPATQPLPRRRRSVVAVADAEVGSHHHDHHAKRPPKAEGGD